MNEPLIDYLQQQIRTTPERVRRFTCSLTGEEYAHRFMFSELSNYIDGFLGKTSASKMIIIPGFRGVGKTTMMAQLCAAYKNKVENILFLSVEDVVELFGVGLSGLLKGYEDILGVDLESVKKPILLFLDEVQSDPKWAITLKSLFERTSNIFFCCTGSAAVILQTTTDLARRAIFETLPPLSFTEYEMIKGCAIPEDDLSEKIRKALYFSQDALEVFKRLSLLQSEVNQYWARISKRDTRNYLAYGSLPFSLMMPNEVAVYDAISLLLDKIIKLDLPELGSFNQETLGIVKRMLFIIADHDVLSLNSLSEKLGVNRLTISNLFDALVRAELLIKVSAYGSNMTSAKKPHKYFFMSPAIRMSFFYMSGQESTYLTRQGKLLEDSFAAHLYTTFILSGKGALRYDSAEGGADFVLQLLNSKQIIIEVGCGEKNKRQIMNSAKKIKSTYNLVISKTELKKDSETNTVFVPLDYYFLL